MFTSIFLIHLLLTSSSIFGASRDRIHPKRIHSMATTISTSSNDASKVSGRVRFENAHRADEQQIKQFAAILYNRLNLVEPPNVTIDINDGTGFPSSFVRQLELQATEEQRLHRDEESRSQKSNDESQATTERVVLPANDLSSASCQYQLASQMNINIKSIQRVQCFGFFQLSTVRSSLPNDQSARQMKILFKKQYFIPDLPVSSLHGDMFNIYQVYRPLSNNTIDRIFPSMTGTRRLPILHVNGIESHWIEITLGPFANQNELQQIYEQFLTSLYGLAVNRQLDLSGFEDSWPSYFAQDYSRRYTSKYFRANDDESKNEDKLRVVYMLIEYGKKLARSTNRNRRANPIRQPAHCDSKSPCCRQPLTIDLDQGHQALNFIIYPRKLDIGQCVGLCGASGSSLQYTDVKNSQYNKESSADHNFFIMHTHRNNYPSSSNSNGAIASSRTNCCSYSRTGGLELLYRTSNAGPIIRKYVPNIIVESCKCGLQATIQEQVDKQGPKK